MKARTTSSRKTVIKGRPDYYITPTHDFTQYTKDSEEKYWSKDTRFDWQQDVARNLEQHLENLQPDQFAKVAFMVLPMIKANIEQKILQVRQQHLPPDEDALKDIAECVPFDCLAIHEAVLMQAPLNQLLSAVAKLKDRLEILNRELLDLHEQQRLGFYKRGTTVKLLETDAERQDQQHELALLNSKISQVQQDLHQLNARSNTDTAQMKMTIREQLKVIESRVLTDLEQTNTLIEQALQSKHMPTGNNELSRLKDLILKRQLRGLKDIANHALVVEQSAIAPLTMGIIHYKRHREIQEAMTTFINDEAKHSATFRRYLVEKLAAKEFISDILIKGAGRYMWLARFMPGAGLFLAVIVEAIGAAYLEFFGKEEYMPDKLFCSISKTISEQDEKRHMDLCVAMYNELFRKGEKWERFRNNVALKVLVKSVYGDKTDDHHLIQAFRAFGVESDVLYQHIMGRLSQQLARISMYVEPDTLLEIIGRKTKQPMKT